MFNLPSNWAYYTRICKQFIYRRRGWACWNRIYPHPKRSQPPRRANLDKISSCFGCCSPAAASTAHTKLPHIIISWFVADGIWGASIMCVCVYTRTRSLFLSFGRCVLAVRRGGGKQDEPGSHFVLPISQQRLVFVEGRLSVLSTV